MEQVGKEYENVPLSWPVITERASQFAKALGEDYTPIHMGWTHNEMATYHKNSLFSIQKLNFWSNL